MNTISNFNLSYTAGRIIGKVAYSRPVRWAWEAARPVRKVARLVKIGVLYPFDLLFYGGVGVLWRTREEWREIIKDSLENGKPLPAIILSYMNEHEDPALKEEFDAWFYTNGNLSTPMGLKDGSKAFVPYVPGMRGMIVGEDH